MKLLARISSGLIAVLFCQLLFFSGQPSLAANGPPGISAEAAAVIDVNSGRLLYEKEADKKMRIASLTKIMTAIVAIESGNLNDVITVEKEAVGVEGSTIYLRAGEHLTLEEMLYGLMLRSGNDAAVAVASHVGESVQGFVHMMNEKAAYIGMTNTNFTNPHGLDDSNMHYSTASDMAKLSAYALQNPVFQEIVGTKVKSITFEGENWDRRLQNKNKLLHFYKGADGIKTGYTKLAKRCLASSATRDGRQLAVITLNAPDDWNDSMRLLDWGFEQFQPVKIVNKGDIIDNELPAEKSNDRFHLVATNEFSYPLKEDEIKQIHSKVNFSPDQLTKAHLGQHVGFIYIYLGQQKIAQVPLIAQAAAPAISSEVKSGFWTQLWRIVAGGLLHA